MADKPWMKFYVGDWVSDPKVRMLTYEEQGIYVNLLFHMWSNGAVLPNSTEKLAKILGISHKKMEKFWKNISTFFIFFEDESGEFFTQKRLKNEWEKSNEISEKRRLATEIRESKKISHDTSNDTSNDTSHDTSNDVSKRGIYQKSEVRSQKLDSEPEKELEPYSPDGESSTGVAAPCPHGQIVSLFSEVLPELPVVKVMSESRRIKLKTRWREDRARQNLDWWREYFLTVKASDFLMGRVPGREGKAPFMASFDWLIKPQNMVKVLEGNYANRASPSTAKPRYERPPTAAEHMRAMSDRLRAEAENEENGGIIDINTGGEVLFDGLL